MREKKKEREKKNSDEQVVMLFVTCPTLMDINLSDCHLITDSVLDR